MGDEFHAQVEEYLRGLGRASDGLLLEMKERARAKEIADRRLKRRENPYS